MRFIKFFIVFITITAILVTAAPPAEVQAATALTTTAVAPYKIQTNAGKTKGVITSAMTPDQNNAEDAPAAYLGLTTPITIYKGAFYFIVPPGIDLAALDALELQVNYKGPAKSTQRWQWSLYDWTTSAYVYVGDNAGALSGRWKFFKYAASDPGRFVNATTREVRAQVKSNNANGDAKIDYAALIFAHTATISTDIFARASALGRGVNFADALEANFEGEWGVIISPEYFQLVKDAGFKSVRLPVRWNAHAAAAYPYTVDPAFFHRIDSLINQGLDQGLIVLLDFHHYIELMSDPQGHRSRFMSIWEQVASHYQGYADNLYFEILNEPNDNLTPAQWSQIFPMALNVIRRTNPTRPVIVDGAYWGGVDGLEQLTLPANDQWLIASFHNYEPFEFTHQGAEWVPGSDAWLGTTWDDTPAEQQAVRDLLDRAQTWGLNNTRPVFMGEFGAYEKADMASRARWTTFVAREAEARNFTWAYWEFGAGFGVYDRNAMSWHLPLMTALIPDQSPPDPQVFIWTPPQTAADWMAAPVRGAVVEIGYGGAEDFEWPPYPSVESFRRLRTLGARVILLEFQYAWTIYPPYAPAEDQFYLVEGALDNAKQAGLYVVLAVRNGPGVNAMMPGIADADVISTLYTDTAAQDAYAAMLTDMVTRLKGRSEIIAWEPIVEPALDYYLLGGEEPPYTESSAIWNPIAARFIDTIRAADPDRPIFISPVNWGGMDAFATLQHFSDDNVVYDLHTYEPYAYTHQMRGPYKTYPGTYWGEYVDATTLDNWLQPVDDFQTAFDVPIVVGEFGGMRWVPNMHTYVADQIGNFNARNWSWMIYAWYDGAWYQQGLGFQWGAQRNVFLYDPENPLYVPIINSWNP